MDKALSILYPIIIGGGGIACLLFAGYRKYVVERDLRLSSALKLYLGRVIHGADTH